MLRSFIVLLTFTCAIFGQFESGTIAAGSLLNFSSVDGGGEDSDPTNVTTIGSNTLGFYSFTIKPMLSYFPMNNVSLDLLFSRTTIKEDDWNVTLMHYGPGASFYLSNIYLGGGYVMLNQSGDDYTSTSNYIEAHGGLLLKLAENVFLDMNASYLMGTGDDVYETDEGYKNENPNESTLINLSVGVKGFFKL